MHFKGEKSAIPNESTSFSDYDSGDVIIVGTKEYVYVKDTTAAASEWIELGDESSFVLKTSQTTDSIGSASAWDAGSTPSLGTAIAADEIGSWNAGTASNAVVSQGILTLTNSTIPSLAHTKKSIPNVESVGSTPSLTITATTVVVP